MTVLYSATTPHQSPSQVHSGKSIGSQRVEDTHSPLFQTHSEFGVQAVESTADSVERHAIHNSQQRKVAKERKAKGQVNASPAKHCHAQTKVVSTFSNEAVTDDDNTVQCGSTVLPFATTYYDAKYGGTRATLGQSTAPALHSYLVCIPELNKNSVSEQGTLAL